MFGRGIGWAALVMVALGPLAAGADEPAPVLRRPLLPVPPQLQLEWPISPAHFSYRAWEGAPSVPGSLPSFRTESLWLRRGPLTLLTTSSIERAPWLDCRLTCQPVLMQTLTAEGRLRLYSGSVVRDAHALARYEAIWGVAGATQRFNLARAGAVRVGVGGLLDL